MIPVCHNLRRSTNKVFKGIATDRKGTMGWCHGFKLHLACKANSGGYSEVGWDCKVAVAMISELISKIGI